MQKIQGGIRENTNQKKPIYWHILPNMVYLTLIRPETYTLLTKNNKDYTVIN